MNGIKKAGRFLWRSLQSGEDVSSTPGALPARQRQATRRVLCDAVQLVRRYGLTMRAMRRLVAINRTLAVDAVDGTGKRVSARTLRVQRREIAPPGWNVSVLMPVPVNLSKVRLLRSLQSLERQTVSCWTLHMFVTEDTFIPLQDARIHLHTQDTSWADACPKNGLVCVLHPGDVLHSTALHACLTAWSGGAQIVYFDEGMLTDSGTRANLSLCKPPLIAPDTLRCLHPVGNAYCVDAVLLAAVGGYAAMRTARPYDLLLRLWERGVVFTHLPQTLYLRSPESSHPDGTDMIRALDAHLARIGLCGQARSQAGGVLRVDYALLQKPLVSLLIPSKDSMTVLRRCVESILQRTTYTPYEILILENNSEQEETFAYYDTLDDARVRVLRWEGPFNYAAINNFGVRHARGDMLLLINNDVEVITPDWIEEMLMFAQRPDVGAVGAKLLYPNDTIQHAGIVLGMGGIAGHGHKGFMSDEPGYMHRLWGAQNVSAVTGACLMVRRELWQALGGMEEAFAVAFNDVDFCMRVAQAGYWNVLTPYAVLYHHESYSRGTDDTPEKRRRFVREIHRFAERWAQALQEGDGHYHPLLTRTREDFSVEPYGHLDYLASYWSDG